MMVILNRRKASRLRDDRVMKKLILLSAVFAVAGSVSGGIAKKTDNNWRKADGSADGVWSDVAHWTLGMPGAAHYA